MRHSRDGTMDQKARDPWPIRGRLDLALVGAVLGLYGAALSTWNLIHSRADRREKLKVILSAACSGRFGVKLIVRVTNTNPTRPMEVGAIHLDGIVVPPSAFTPPLPHRLQPNQSTDFAVPYQFGDRVPDGEGGYTVQVQSEAVRIFISALRGVTVLDSKQKRHRASKKSIRDGLRAVARAEEKFRRQAAGRTPATTPA